MDLNALYTLAEHLGRDSEVARAIQKAIGTRTITVRSTIRHEPNGRLSTVVAHVRHVDQAQYDAHIKGAIANGVKAIAAVLRKQTRPHPRCLPPPASWPHRPGLRWCQAHRRPAEEAIPGRRLGGHHGQGSPRDRHRGHPGPPAGGPTRTFQGKAHQPDRHRSRGQRGHRGAQVENEIPGLRRRPDHLDRERIPDERDQGGRPRAREGPPRREVQGRGEKVMAGRTGSVLPGLRTGGVWVYPPPVGALN